MNTEDTVAYFRKTLQDYPDMSEAVAAIKTLIQFITLNSAETLVGLRESLKATINILTTCIQEVPTAGINSGCELFLRFITLTGTALDNPDFQQCKQILVDRGNIFLDKVASSRRKIAKLAHPFLTDGSTILVHSRSRVVLQVLTEAIQARKRFTVYCTESMPDNSGTSMASDLSEMGIPTVTILDAAVGYVMEKVDFVLVGAEGVVESGGIINKIGTFTVAVCAKQMNKPFYVVAESFKFARLFPLNQGDIPNHFKYKASKADSDADLTKEHPLVDYTPPSFITLLFTDLGVLTPSAVSDELIKLYQ